MEGNKFAGGGKLDKTCRTVGDGVSILEQFRSKNLKTEQARLAQLEVAPTVRAAQPEVADTARLAQLEAAPTAWLAQPEVASDAALEFLRIGSA